MILLFYSRMYSHPLQHVIQNIEYFCTEILQTMWTLLKLANVVFFDWPTVITAGKVRHDFGKNCAIVEYFGTHIKSFTNWYMFWDTIVTWKIYSPQKLYFFVYISQFI